MTIYKYFNMWVMSCTENESGPFVVFFLPAVVGCLTILLARRWANSQVSNTSSTAVSRRRKIIKDPLIKRPLPPIACKMVAPGSKKAAGASKKVRTLYKSLYTYIVVSIRALLETVYNTFRRRGGRWPCGLVLSARSLHNAC